jgi:hypothetical protein
MVKYSRNKKNKNKPKYSRKASNTKYSRKASKPKEASLPSRNKRNRRKYSVRRKTPRNFNPPIVVSTPAASSVMSSISEPWSDNIPMNASSPEILNSGLTDAASIVSNEVGVIFGDENNNSLHDSDLHVNAPLNLSDLRTPSNKTTVEESDL